MSVNIQGLDNLLIKADNISRMDMNRALFAAGTAVKAFAQDKLASGGEHISQLDGSHQLPSSIKVRVNGNMATIGTNVEYAAYVEFGTGLHGPLRHIIRPRHKKVMHFITKDGREVFTRSIEGMHPFPFMRPALADHKKEVRDAFNEAVRGALKKEASK